MRNSRTIIGVLLLKVTPLLLVSMVTVSCNPSPSTTNTSTPSLTPTEFIDTTPTPYIPQDTSFIQYLREGQSDGCTWPCWHEVTPGMTTETDLMSSSFFSDASRGELKCASFGPNSQHWSGVCLWRDSERMGVIVRFLLGLTANHEVVQVSIPSGSSTKMGDMTILFGDPEVTGTYRDLESQSRANCSAPKVDAQATKKAVYDNGGDLPFVLTNHTEIFYPSLGAIVSTDDSEPVEAWPMLCPNSYVGYVILAAKPTALNEWLEQDMVFYPFDDEDKGRLGAFPGWGQEIRSNATPSP